MNEGINTCGNCTFFDPASTDPIKYYRRLGKCKFRSFSFVGQETWLAVLDTDWCRDWEQRKEGQPKLKK